MNVTWAASFGFPLLRDAAFTVFLYREPGGLSTRSSVLFSRSACDLTALWSPQSPTASIYSNEAERCPGLFLDVELLRLWVNTDVDITCLNTTDRWHMEVLVYPNCCWCYLRRVVHPVVVRRANGSFTLFLNCSPQYSLNLFLFKTGSPYIALKLIK